MVEHRLAKARVAGSNPVSRSNFFNHFCKVSTYLLPYGHGSNLSHELLRVNPDSAEPPLGLG